MEDDPSSSKESVLPWLWVIEYLAYSQQAKASLLHAVLEVAPEVPDDLGKDMREMVALRCLEELCGPRIEMAGKGSLEDTGSKLDLSKSCEKVLASVFPDDSVSDLKEAEKELLKWDIGSFLEHKRVSMPLTALQRLNMKITEGVRLQASPLRDVTGLASRNTGGGASAEHNEPGLDTDGNNSGDHEGVRGNRIPMPMEQSDNLTKECDDAKISPRAKRSRTDPAMENLEESFDVLRHSNGRSTDDHSIAKRLKQCQPSDLDSDPTIVPDSFHSPPKESTNLEEDRIRTSEEGQILGGRDENVTLQSANSPDKYKNSVDTDDLLGKIDGMSTKKIKINESSSTSLNKETESRQIECLPARHDAEKMSSNTDLHIDVAEHDRKNLEFLNCVTEQNVCMKCGEGGQLMACPSCTCPLVVHKNCVGLSATFDADGLGFCGLHFECLRLGKTMKDDPSSSKESVLPWLWVIEYLASFQQVKASLLHAVLEVAPEVPYNLGKDMREIVALRCLEELCGPRIEMAGNGSLEDTGSKLDLSKTCEEVLASVFRDDSVSDLKEAEKELLKWDIGSFLEHKRASMPLTALQRLNMKITECARLQASPLRDVAGLASRNTGGGTSAEHNEPGLDTDRSNSGDHEGVTGNLIPMPMEQRDNLTKDCDDARISPHAKRSRTDPAMENLEESFDDLRHSNGRSTDDHSIAKRLKQCQPTDLDSDPTIVPDSFDSPPKESTNLEEDRIRTSEEGHILGGRDENVTLQSSDSPDKYKNSVDTDDLLGKIDDMLTEKVKINESNSSNKEMESRQTECLARHDAEKMSSNTDLPIDVAEHDRKRLEFLNCGTGQNVCMKCGEGGQLIACHGSTCPLVVHENCVGLSVTFDTDGNFHCPFCSCCNAITEYLDSVKEASTAWQELVSFFDDALIHQPNRLYLVLGQRQSVHGRDEIVEECENGLRKRRTEAGPDGYGDNSVQVCNYDKKGTEGGDKDKSEPSPRICSKNNNKDFLLRQGSQEKENGDTDMTDNNNSKLDLQIPEVDVTINQQDEPVDNLVDQVNDAPSPKFSAKGAPENANEESYCFRGRGSKEVRTMPIQRRTRQKKAEWTADEEMILKEGVEKYSDKSFISWTNILVFGGDLLKGRTTRDLKNRWNNMHRKAGKRS